MIIVDDRLSLEALAGRFGAEGATATTWGFHYRLLRALEDPSRWGVLSRAVTDEIRSLAAEPPASRLRVLDPRQLTSRAATLAARHGLNLLAAELVAGALEYQAGVWLSGANVGRSWPEVMAAEGVELQIVP